jgi:PASTA domain-containing protein
LSVLLVLFGGNTVNMGYSQQEQFPPQGNQQAEQEEQRDQQLVLQRLQRVQNVSELGVDEEEEEEEEEEMATENATGPTENDSEVFSYVTEVPSLRDLRKIQIETDPGSALRDEAIGSAIFGTPFEDAIGNSTSNGNLTSLANLTSIPNMTSLANFTPAGNLTATLNARNPDTTEPVPDTAGSWSGCDTGYWGRVNPEWVLVKPTAESPRWTDPVIVEGNMTFSRIAVNYQEFPFNHHSHDRTFHFDPDPAYANLDSTREGNIEAEWEIGHTKNGATDRFPKEFWPWAGDRIWMMGWWVIDCGHFKLRVVGTDPTGEPIFEAYDYKTEIHPPFMTAFTRIQPLVFLGEQNPSSAAVTHVYLHGRGGTFDTLVGGQVYEFDIDMPKCTGPILVCSLRQLKYEVKSLPFGGPAPVVTDMLLENKAHVVINLTNVQPSPDLRYGAVVAAKWVGAFGNPIANESSRTLKVTFDSIEIREDHDYFSGEWNSLWVGVNGKWIELSGPLGHYGLDDADDDDTFNFPARSKSVTVTVPENGQLEIFSTGWESDQDSCFLLPSLSCTPVTLANINDAIGYIRPIVTCSQNFDVGNGEQYAVSQPSSSDDETDGDYILSYHVEELSRTVGNEVCGDPPVRVPDATCYSIGEAITIIKEPGLNPRFSQTGGPIVVNQVPQPDTYVAPGSDVHLIRGNICP